MDQVARYVKMLAEPGYGAELTSLLLKAADDLADEPGCLLFLVSREQADPDTVWVTELWRSQADLDAGQRMVRGAFETTAVLRLVASAERVELELLGGKGPAPS